MKVAVITDTHFGARNDSQAFSDYFYRFWTEVFFPYLIENKIDTIIHAGDLMDRRKYVNFDTLNRMRKEFIQPLIDNGMTMHTIVGNHDTYYKNTVEVNSVEELFDIKSTEGSPVVAYSKPSTVRFDDGYEVDLIPWINAENYDDVMAFINNTKSKICFGHFDLSGFEMHKGVKSAYHSMDPSFLDKYHTAYSGHFHTKSDNGHIYYLGNTYEMTWSDYNDKRGFHVFDTETLECEHIVNPFIMHSKIVYDDSQIHNIEEYENRIVKLIVSKKEDHEYFNMVVDTLQKSCENLTIIEDFGMLSNEQIEYEAEDTITTLNNYVDNLNIDNQEQVKKILHEVYVEALAI